MISGSRRAPQSASGKYFATDADGCLLARFVRSARPIRWRAEIILAAVAPESAALRTGLSVGDRIVAIDGAKIPTRSLSDWRRELRKRPAGTKLPIRYERDGKTRSHIDAHRSAADQFVASYRWEAPAPRLPSECRSRALTIGQIPAQASTALVSRCRIDLSLRL
jgi:membrane-associated protease RseP (regulator of RpoE activity)